MSEKLDIQIQSQLGKSGASKVAQYQDLFVGDRSYLSLIVYESVTLIATRFPGGIGNFLRRKLYPLLLGKVGRNVNFGKDVWLRHPGRISIGADTKIENAALLDAKGAGAYIKIGANCDIGEETVLSCKDGYIEIGDNVKIGARCNISSNSSIKIANNSIIESGSCLFATAHNFDDVDTPILDQGWSSHGILVNDSSIVRERSVILDAVTLGKNCEVLADSVVTKDVPPGVKVSGAPASACA